MAPQPRRSRQQQKTRSAPPKPKLGYSDSERVTMGIHPQCRAAQPWTPRPSKRAALTHNNKRVKGA